jgi:lipoprotein-releasing system permease protein
MKRLAWFVARKGDSSNAASQNVMLRIASIAVAVSIAVMVVSLSVIFGFKEQISSLVSGVTADVTIASPYADRVPEEYPLSDTEALQTLIRSSEEIAHVERYALRSGIVRGEEGAVGIALKGVDCNADLSLFAERIESGAMPRFEESRRKEILLSKELAEKIGASTDSRIEIVLMEEERPRRELFKVCGIYRTALGDVASSLAITDIRNVQKLNNWEASQISGYACRLHNSERSMECAERLNQRLFYEYEGEESIVAISSRERHADIFGWLDTHDINAVVILTIMLVVAIFNMITALLILVLERTRMVGTLKSLGMPNGTIRQIFTIHASRIILRGAIVGNVLALSLLLAQKYLHIVKLDESGYFLAEVPVALDWWWIIAINIIFVAIILAVTHLATSIVGRIKVAEAIKYN